MSQFLLPDLGENISAGEVVKVLVTDGQTVAKDQIVIEIETDKAVVEVPSTVAGKITRVLAKAGQKLKVGEAIFEYDSSSSENQNAAKKIETAATIPSPLEGEGGRRPAEGETPLMAKRPSLLEPPLTKRGQGEFSSPDSNASNSPNPLFARGGSERDFTLPELGENIAGGEVVKVLVKDGQTVNAGQNVIEVETDKAVIEVPIPNAGTIQTVVAKAGQKIKVGEVVLKYATTSEPPLVKKPSVLEPPLVKRGQGEFSSPDSNAGNSPNPLFTRGGSEVAQQPLTIPKLSTTPVLAAPSVRKLAREIGVEIQDVKPHEKNGRITIEDVKAHAKTTLANYKAQKIAPVGGSLPQIELPDFSRWGEFDKKPMSGIRKATALRMTQAWSTIPQVTQTDEADVTLLEDLRQKFSKRAEALGTKLTSTAILLKIVASALKVFPQFNASVDMAHEEIIYKKYYHIGVAVDTDRGLLVPVVRDVNKKNILDLAVELNTISEKARTRKTTLDEMQGGSFTISNLGGIGGGHFTPIINPPEVAILGVGKWKLQAVYNKTTSAFEPRKILPLSLTYDHRLIDGADAARFLRWLCEAVQDPFLMELEG